MFYVLHVSTEVIGTFFLCIQFLMIDVYSYRVYKSIKYRNFDVES